MHPPGLRRRLLVTQCLGWPDPRGLQGGQPGRQKGHGECQSGHKDDFFPRYLEGKARYLSGHIGDNLRGRDQRQTDPQADAQQGHEGLLDQEDPAHHLALEPEGAQHADLLASLHDGARADDAQCGDAYD